MAVEGATATATATMAMVGATAMVMEDGIATRQQRQRGRWKAQSRLYITQEFSRNSPRIPGNHF